MTTLDYHKPDPPKTEARPVFRVGAWMMFVLSLEVTAGSVHALVTGAIPFALTVLAGVLPGCWMFGRIAISGRLY